MSRLGPDARALLEAACGGDEPSDEDAARVRAKVAARLAVAAAAGAAGAAVSTKAGAGTGAAVATAASAKGAVGAGAVGVGGVAAGAAGGGVVAGGATGAAVAAKLLMAVALVGGAVTAGVVGTRSDEAAPAPAVVVVVAAKSGSPERVSAPTPQSSASESIALPEPAPVTDREEGGGETAPPLPSKVDRSPAPERARAFESPRPGDERRPVEASVHAAPADPGSAPALRSAPEPPAAEARTASLDARAIPPAPAILAESGGASAPGSIPASPAVLPASPRDRVAEEAALLRAAHAALARGDAAGALDRLEVHAARFPSGSLVEERRAARVLALCAAGRAVEARAAAATFLAASPRSPLAAQVRRACAPAR